MRLNRKQKLFTFLLIFSVIIGRICFLYYTNKSRNLNVLLITIDALRPDHLGCYGYKRNTSPNIDRLAKEGVLFTQAIAQSSHTPPSIGTILTSTFPYTHLLINWGSSIRSDLPTITSILKSKGYKTIFVSSANGIFLKGLHGFTKGFDIFYDEGGNAFTLTDKALNFLTNLINKQPFFLWIHYMDVHSPYIPSKTYDKLYIGDRVYDNQKKLPIVKNYPDQYGYKGIADWLAQVKGRVDNPDYYIAQYDGAIRTVDEQIGIILKKLRQLRMNNETIFIVTADHGEMLGEHDYYFHHGWFLYEPLIKIPFIIKCDKIIPQKKIIDIQINAHLDIAPTILATLKIAKPKTMEGINLVRIISEIKKYYYPYVFADEGHAVKCIRNNNWKLIYNKRNAEKYELYNLKDDPQELNNLVYKEKEKFGFLKQKLDEFVKIDMRTKEIKPNLDEKTKERLRSLGYTQ